MHFFRSRSQSPVASTSAATPVVGGSTHSDTPPHYGGGASSAVNSARSVLQSNTPPHSGRRSPLAPSAVVSSSTPPSPVPAGSLAPRPRHLVKSVESHVRLTSHMEHLATSSSSTAVRLRLPSNSSASATGSEGLWSEAFTVTRAHRGGSTQQFYNEVVAPCVANSIAGQSYVFLLNGPMESGRSQAMYGSPHHSEMGLVELTAMDLLQRAADRRAAAAAAAAEAPPIATGASSSRANSPSPTPPAGAKHEIPTGEVLSALAGLTVTYSAFLCRGSQVVETVSTPSHSPGTANVNHPVEWVTFPPPLSLVPLARMQLLQTARESVVLPEKKHSDTSCVIQFQVYAPVDLSGTRSLATLTFIDVAAIKLPLCREVDHLLTTVRRVAGVDRRAAPQFQDTALTALLEPALKGGATTLVNITMISGRPDLYESAAVALQFAADISRIHQVLLLTHIRTPRWLFEAGQSLEFLQRQGQQDREAHYARGVQAYFEVVQRWLQQQQAEAERLAAQLAVETEAVRDQLKMEASHLERDLKMQITEASGAAERTNRQCRAIQQLVQEHTEQVSRLQDQLRRVQHESQSAEHDVAHRIAAIRLELSSSEASQGLQKQEMIQLRKSLQMYEERSAEMLSTMRSLSEDLLAASAVYGFTKELSALKRRRARLEEELVAVSKIASQRNDRYVEDRQRRKKVARLQGVEARLKALQQLAAEQAQEM